MSETKKHLLNEMGRALEETDFERAKQLESVAEIPEELNDAKLNFVKVSGAVERRIGIENCLVFEGFPDNVRDNNSFYAYREYLVREARRQNALGYYTDEKLDYIAVQFPGGPEELYTIKAFEGSLFEFFKKQQEIKGPMFG